MARPGAVVVGSGPNGLAAAITLAREGWRVQVLEAADTAGGGMRTAGLTLPGFRHDVCSSVHPLALSSPFFASLPPSPGLDWIQPSLPLAHPFDDGSAAALDRSVSRTAALLGEDEQAYQRLVSPLVRRWEALCLDILGPLRMPRHPLLLVRFGLRALWPAAGVARIVFSGRRARALFAGLAAHAILPLERIPSAAFGLVLAASAHAVGWPFARGGSQRISDALVSELQALGGAVITGREVTSLATLADARAILLDVTPRQALAIAGLALPPGYRRQLGRYRYGPGVFKLDWALSEPIPWRAEACRIAGTVHLGGSPEEIAAAERAVWRGAHPERPFVILSQPSLFDKTRAPAGKHTAWAYCHVPHGSTVDMTSRVEAQVERFAPGFRDAILARHAMPARELQRYNPNYIGGDINSGIQDLWQLYTRPVPRLAPYTTPNSRLFLCSASTPPGGGVHGMCGYHAAQAVLAATRMR